MSMVVVLMRRLYVKRFSYHIGSVLFIAFLNNNNEHYWYIENYKFKSED